MKSLYLALTGILSLFASTHMNAQHREIALLTFNIRFDNPGDDDNRWANRKAYVAETIHFFDVEVCGMQEALAGQIEDLLAMLPGYAYVGVGRDDGRQAGEFSPIFYDSTQLTLMDNGTFWLSDTPEQVSKGWDAALPRIATWAKLEDKATGKAFFVFNSHFDHVGKTARKESAALLIRKVKELAAGHAVFIMGDFNARPEEEPVQLFLDAWTDCKAASLSPHFGPEATFNGFGPAEIESMRIDFIFHNAPGVSVLKHAAISQTWAGRFASDHHAVYALLILPASE